MAIGDPGLQPVNLFMTLFPFLLSSLIVCTRIARRLYERKFSTEDALIGVAQVLLLGLTIATWVFIKKSYTGYHLQNIPKGAVNKTLIAKWRYVIAVIYNPLLGLIKISFTLTLISLQASKKAIRWSLWALLTVNIMFTIAGTFVSMFSCVPIPKFWDRTLPGTCLDPKKYIYSTISVTILTDIWVTAMPAWILHNLQIPRKDKITVICFLSLGLAVSAIASYRLYFFVQVLENPDPVTGESPYNIRTPLSNIEANVAAIAACGATLKWILGRCIPFFDSSRRNGTSKYSGNSASRYHVDRSKQGYQRSKDDTVMDVTVAEFREYCAESRSGSVIEMQDEIGWKGTKHRSDARTSEQRVTSADGIRGITKTVGWEVRGKDAQGRYTPDQRPEHPRSLV